MSVATVCATPRRADRTARCPLQAYEIIRLRNLNCTLHAGEAAGPESILDAIRYCGAHRIGHGCSLIRDAKLMQFVVDKVRFAPLALSW